MKIINIVLCFLLITSSAFSEIVIKKKASGDTYSDIILFWRAESFTLSTGDYPTSGTISSTGTASISNTAAVVGSNGLLLTAGGDYADITSYFPGSTKGRIGFWWVHAAGADFDASGEWMIRYEESSPYDSIGLLYYTNQPAPLYKNNGTDTWGSGPDNMSGTTAYYIELAWDTDNDYITVFVSTNASQDTTGTVTSMTQSPFTVGGGVFSIGRSDGSTLGSNTYIDNVIVSSNPTRNLWALRNLTTSPR